MDNVEEAAVVLEKPSDETRLSGISVVVKVKPRYHKLLLGRAGVNIQKLRVETGARIIFPAASDVDRESIIIVGNANKGCRLLCM